MCGSRSSTHSSTTSSKSRSASLRDPPRSDPPAPAEERDLHERRHDDEAHRRPDRPVAALELAGEVLAVEADHERRDEHERGDDRELLADLVLVLGDLRLQVVADAGEEVA